MSGATNDGSQSAPSLDLPSSNHSSPELHVTRSARSYWGWIALAGIVIIPVLGSLYWIRTNVLFVGHDASSYLLTLHDYLSFLTPPSWQGLFQAFAYSTYRAPGLYLIAYPFYALFGPSPDAAQIANVLLLACLIVLTYQLGCEFGKRLIQYRHADAAIDKAADWRSVQGIGLMSALIVGFLPIVAGMSRLFYTEMLLTVSVTLNLLALLRSHGFQHRGWTLVWGASLGVGLLAKWTMPIYIALPTLWVLVNQVRESRALSLPVRPSRLQEPAKTPDGLRPWMRIAIALAAGIAFSAIWYLPNREFARTLPLGDWMAPIWAVLTALLIYTLLSMRQRVSPWWAAVFLAVWIASLWYLPRVDIFERLVEIDAERGQETAGIFNPENYRQYARYFYIQHLGPLLFWLMAPVTMLAWIVAWVRRRTPPDSAILWLSLLSALAVLLLLSQRNSRNLVPCLPVFAVLATLALAWLPTYPRLMLGATWVALLLAQWSMVTFDAAAVWRNPALGPSTEYAVPPASGPTDPAYHIAPDILTKIASSGPGPHSLGVLVNTHQLHPGAIKYWAALEQAPVHITDLTDTNSPAWSGMIGSQWLIWKDGDNRNVESAGQTALAEIAAQNPLFGMLFSPVAEYSLPDGDTVHLYHRSSGPGFPAADAERMEAAMPVSSALNAAASPYSTIIYGSPSLAVWVGMQTPLPGSKLFVKPEIQALIAPAATETGVIQTGNVLTRTVSTGTVLTGTVLAVLDADSAELETWLDVHSYRSVSTGNDLVAVVIYGLPVQPLEESGATADWEDMQLVSLRTHLRTQPGLVLPLEPTLAGNLNPDRKLSYRLVGSDGHVLAASDRALATSDQFGLFVPPNTAPGAYSVVALMYDAQTQAVLPDHSGNDHVVLFQVTVAD